MSGDGDENRALRPNTFFCIDGHTCGNPVRLVAGGGPPLRGATMSEPGCHEVPPEYPEFSALFYALDVTMPFFDLQQKSYWVMNPTHSNAWFYQLWGPINIALGWLFSILAAVGFSGILRKD